MGRGNADPDFNESLLSALDLKTDRKIFHSLRRADADHLKEDVKKHFGGQSILSSKYSSNTKAYMSVYPESSQDAARDSAYKILATPYVSVFFMFLRDEQLLQGIISSSEALVALAEINEDARAAVASIVIEKRISGSGDD